jgi:4-hydroxybenzoyl-CoA reductase subunit beta
MIAAKTYHKCQSVEEAIALALKHGEDFRYMAGGTDVIINKFQGNDETNCLIDISAIPELKQVSNDWNVLRIGSLVKLDDLKKHKTIADHFPALLEAAHSVASPMIRKTATIGGNILCENRCIFYNQSEWWREAVGYCLKCEGDVCIATGGKKNCFSKFVSDTAPVLICLDAQIEVFDTDGVKLIKLEDIYTGDGVNPRQLNPKAIVTAILLPLDKDYRCVFKKLRPRESVDYTSLTTAVSIDKKGRIKIALGGVDPGPVVAEGIGMSAIDSLILQVFKKARVIDNDFYTRPYRKEMIKVFLQRSFAELGNTNKQFDN